MIENFSRQFQVVKDEIKFLQLKLLIPEKKISVGTWTSDFTKLKRISR